MSSAINLVVDTDEGHSPIPGARPALPSQAGVGATPDRDHELSPEGCAAPPRSLFRGTSCRVGVSGSMEASWRTYEVFVEL